MITFIGAALGFLSSAFPSVLKFYREKEDRRHELALFDRQVDLMKLGHSQRLEEVKLQADYEETRALYQHAKISGGAFIDALSASVRPVITYAFFGLYAALKISQIYFVGDTLGHQGWYKIMLRVWHEEDQALFATVMSFWFGQRALSRFMRPRRK